MDVMASSSKHTEWILETIDHLRRRKARPDLERICHVVRRRYCLSASETEDKLEKLVDAEIVIKVDYKGSTSYRNAAKWRKSMLGCAVLNSTTISTKILEAILELSRSQVKKNAGKERQDELAQHELQQDELAQHELAQHELQQDELAQHELAQHEACARLFATETGVPLDSVNEWLKKHCDGFDNLRSPLTIVLKREIDAGRVKRLMNCNYVITAAQIEEICDKTIRPLKATKKPETRAVDSPCTSQNGSVVASANEESSSNSLAGDQKLPSQADQRPVSTPPPTVTSSAPQPARRGRPPKHRSAVSPSQVPGCMPSTAPAAVVTGSSAHSKLKRILTSDSHGQTEDGPEPKVPKKMETRQASSVGEPACDLCQLTCLGNPQGLAETLLLCKDCTSKAHPSCMNYSHLLASRAYRGPWQCMYCKTCCVCQDAGDPDQMLFCDGCDKGYHMNCHHPPIMKKPSGIWECSECRLENLSLQRSEFMSRQGNHHTVSHESAPPTPAESPVPTNLLSNVDNELPKRPCYLGDDQYPDASGWSVKDVVEHLTSAGFSEEAKMFHEQEIDGVALLLLKRTDVLRGLSLKLGPALKLNRHIQGLQTAHQHDTTQED